jgi:hypothetical protein
MAISATYQRLIRVVGVSTVQGGGKGLIGYHFGQSARSIEKLVSRSHQLKRSLVFRLEFPQPGLDSRKEMGIRTVRATQFSAFTRQTRETPCIHIEARINQVAARGTYKLQHSHRYLHTVYCNQAACVLAKRW